MRKNLLLLIFIISAPVALSAQGMFGFSFTGVRSADRLLTRDHGIGAGIVMYSVPKPFSSNSDLEFSIGARFSYTGFGNSDKIEYVPLLAPQTGRASVKFRDNLTSLNGSFRLCYPEGKFIPYLTCSGGFRIIQSFYSINPYNPMPGYQSSTDTSLFYYAGGNVGFGAGVMYNLFDHVVLDCSLDWSSSYVPGHIIDLTTPRLNGSSVVYCTHQAPANLIFLNLAIYFKMTATPVITRDYYLNDHHSGHAHGSEGGSPNHISSHSSSH